MGGGGGWDPFEDLKNMADDPFGTIVSGIVNASTLGMIGYNDGKFGRGVIAQAVDESVGEVSGRNQARKAAMNAQDQVREAKTEAERQRQFEQQRRDAQERQASGLAASRSRRAQRGTVSTTTQDVEAELSTQFLGL